MRTAFTALVLAIGLAACAAGPSSEAAKSSATSLSTEAATSVTFAEQRGLEIYQRDRAAWLATIADGVLTNSAIYEDIASRPAFTKDERSALAARVAAIKHSDDLNFCDGQYNTVIIPTATGHDIYLLAPRRSSKQVQLGGHFRVPVNTDGVTGTVQLFSNTCLAIDRDAEAAAVMVTYPLGTTPNEMHVFKSVSHDIPIAVMTAPNQKMWLTEQGKISLTNP
jgi:hypothetical protein